MNLMGVEMTKTKIIHQVKVQYGSVGYVTSSPSNLFVEGIKNSAMTKDAYGVKGTTVTLVCVIAKQSTTAVDWYVFNIFLIINYF